MNEYYKCRNCNQVVQGWNARGIKCCESPDYEPTSGPQDEMAGVLPETEWQAGSLEQELVESLQEFEDSL